MSVEAPIVVRLIQDDEPRPGDTVQCCGADVEVTGVWAGGRPREWIVTAARGDQTR